MSREKDLALLGKVLCNHGGLLTDLCAKLDSDPTKWEPAFGRFLRGENPWLEIKRSMKVLRKLDQVAEFHGTDVFKVSDYLRLTPVSERATADLFIGYLCKIGENFLDKIEKDIPASRLRAYALKKESFDNLIFADLGGEESAETTFFEMIALMKAQGRGQKGILLINDYPNIFYIRDAKGVLWAVYCRWYSNYGYWRVNAGSISSSYSGNAGGQVFRRDSGS